MSLAVLTGCASAPQSRTFLAPGLSPDTRYDGFLAYAAFKDIVVEDRFETALCKRLERARHACSTMLSEASPTRGQTGASRQRAARTSGAQALVSIELINPATASRQLLAAGQPAFDVRLVDLADGRIIARMAIQPERKHPSSNDDSQAVADAVVVALQRRHLLRSR